MTDLVWPMMISLGQVSRWTALLSSCILNARLQGPAPDPRRTRIDGIPHAPHILSRGIITPIEAESLFKMYFQVRLSESLLY